MSDARASPDRVVVLRLEDGTTNVMSRADCAALLNAPPPSIVAVQVRSAVVVTTRVTPSRPRRPHLPAAARSRS